MSAISLGDVNHRALRVLLGNRCLTKAGLQFGALATVTAENANTVEYCIDGIVYRKTHTDNLFTFSDHSVQAINTTRLYACCLDKDGNGSIVNGTAVSTAAIAAGTAKLRVPEVADTLVIVGVIKVVTTTTAFTPGTTHLDDGTGVTTTYTDIAVVPNAAL